MFVVALFTVAKIWKQHNCSSLDELIKIAAVQLHNVILHSSKKEETNLL